MPVVWILLLIGQVVADRAAPADDIPSSPRSRQVTARIQPALEQALKTRGLQLGSPIFLRIFKATKELEVWVVAADSFQHFRTYEICRFSGNLGPKLREGDLQAPEGFYFVAPRHLNPHSRFHLSFDLGYPNAYDRAHHRTGSALFVHGSCVSIGCYAMTDAGIEEIYTLADAAFRQGQQFFRVHVFPFRLTEHALEQHLESPWLEFWHNLKQGYDSFESRRWPPDVRVVERKYTFVATQ